MALAPSCSHALSVQRDPSLSLSKSSTTVLHSSCFLHGGTQHSFRKHGSSTFKVKKSSYVWASLSESGEYHAQRPPTPLLDTINYPIHMKNLSLQV
ncbi:hypothetical protein EJ110_NYTH26566 [Nymphaea thermarum]|nr:hypothetical protein EJ110_NYTH26566 [Nymphaea thermarum]